MPTVDSKPPDLPRTAPAPVTVRQRIENGFEQTLFASRWLLAPFFAGLALSMLLLLVKFALEFVHLVTIVLTASGSQLIGEMLGLVDLTLTASLLVIVVFSGYENFVSRIDHTQHRDWPSWMGTIDFTGLKLKLMASIVAISAVQLLRLFLALGTVSDRELWWSVTIHLLFVVSTVLLALSDRLTGGGHAVEPKS